MNKQTIEVLEETKTSLNKHFSQWGDTELTINPVLDDVLSTAIQALKALDQAEKELGEKKVFTEGCFEPDINYQGNCTGFNEMHDIAKPIIAHKDLRIGFLELTNRAINKELQSLTKENEVLREQNLDAVKDYKELQSLKSKLSRENLENVIDTEGLGIHFEEMGNSIGVYQALRKQLVQAIQKACGINDGGGE